MTDFDAAKTKRRWLRYGLRSLLVSVQASFRE